MIDKVSDFTLRELFGIPAFWITLVLIIGFVFAPGAADIDSIKSAGGGFDAGGKLIRVVTAVFAGVFALLSLLRGNALSSILKGNLGILFIYTCLAYFSVVFSELRVLTIYKSSELVVMLFIAATLYGRSLPFVESRRYLTGLFWIYSFTAIGVLLQLLYYGTAAYTPVHSTPFISFMLSSKHPPLAANSVGMLGALVSIFGVYQFYKCESYKKRCYIIGTIIGVFGLITLVLSYTRSALVLFVFASTIFLYFNRKFVLLTLAGFCVIALLAVGSARDLMESHMRRGGTDEKIATLSSRVVVWNSIIKKDLLKLIVGEGYATGTQFQDLTGDDGSETINLKNAHNSVFEVINSTGIIGAFVWLFLITRINLQLFQHLLRTRRIVSKDEYVFHLFISSVFVLATLRSFMNSTFVYLDYFLPLLFSIAVYADTLKLRRSELYNDKNISSSEFEESVDRVKNTGLSILSYKKTKET